MPTNPNPSRGEIWLVDMGMVEKVRPALVLSGPPDALDRDVITVIPHTTALRGSRLEVPVSAPFLKTGAFLAQSPATLPRQRALKYLGRLRPEDVYRIEGALIAWLGITRPSEI
jgi:mRNA interferase MazF